MWHGGDLNWMLLGAAMILAWLILQEMEGRE